MSNEGGSSGVNVSVPSDHGGDESPPIIEPNIIPSNLEPEVDPDDQGNQVPGLEDLAGEGVPPDIQAMVEDFEAQVALDEQSATPGFAPPTRAKVETIASSSLN